MKNQHGKMIVFGKHVQIWTDEEKKALKENTVDAPVGFRLSPSELARLPSLSRRTKYAISDKINMWGWADPEISKRVRSGKRLSAEQVDWLNESVGPQGEYRFLPSSVIARMIGVKTTQIRNFRYRRGWSLTRTPSPEAKNDPEYRRWFEGREGARVKALKTKLASKKAIHELSIRSELVSKLNSRCFFRVKRHKCVKCHVSWPHTIDFFYSRKMSDESRSVHFVLTDRCRACLPEPSKKNRVRPKRGRP